MLNFLYYIFIFPLESGMKFVLTTAYGICQNYGISIVVMSLAVNIVLLPLYYLAEYWQGKEREIKKKMEPEINKIKAAFTGEKRYYYINAIYKRFKYHPLYSIRVSFGFLIQVPFFIAAYHYLSHLEKLTGESFLFIYDLFAPDKLINFGTVAINVLPIIMTAVNIFSSYIYTKNLGKNEKIQLWALALLFLVLLYNSPAALVFYWTCNNIFSLIKNTLSVYVFKLKAVNPGK
jgi:YidC/Oxa1 family membrane protein insertase